MQGIGLRGYKDMRLELNGFLISTDGSQFILKKRPNTDIAIQKDRWEIIGYYSTFDLALSKIPQEILLMKYDVSVIKDKLSTLESAIRSLDTIVIDNVKEEVV